MSIIVQLIAGLVQTVPSLLANWKKILEAVLSVISAINWLNIGKTILTGVANGVKSMGSSLLNAFKGGFSSALAWIKSLPSQAVQWGKNLIQSFINGLTGKGGAVGAGAIAATAGATIAKTASGNDWSSVWADANADVADSAQSMAEVVVPAYTKSGDAATKAAKKTKAAAQAAETLLWSLQDAGHTDTTNALGKVTIQTTELTEHLRKGSEEYDRLTRTVTESGKEMVNGVVKNYKTVTKYVTDHGKTTAQTQKTYEEIAATVRDTVTSTFDSVVDGVRTSTQTVTETLTDETTQQKQIITKTCTDIVNGMLVTKEQVETIAADGARTTAETIKEASANTFSGLLKGWQEEADKGILGTFDTLVTAIKKQDWKSVGEWVLSTLYTGQPHPANQRRIAQGRAGRLAGGVEPRRADRPGCHQRIWQHRGSGRQSGPDSHQHLCLPQGSAWRCSHQHQHGAVRRTAVGIPGHLQRPGRPHLHHWLCLCGHAAGHRRSTAAHRHRHASGHCHDRRRRGSGGRHCRHHRGAGRGVQAQAHQLRQRGGQHCGGLRHPMGLRAAPQPAAAHPAAQHRGQPVHLQQSADGCRPDA